MAETSIVSIGPYTLEVQETPKGISRISILEKPSIKSKSLNNSIDQYMRKQLDVDGTPFQKKVWEATRKIPFGETRTYAQIAEKIGHPKAVRAVGTALGRNPVFIVVPCHRVIPSSGGIGNYAYGKVMKQWLLDHEAARKA